MNIKRKGGIYRESRLAVNGKKADIFHVYRVVKRVCNSNLLRYRCYFGGIAKRQLRFIGRKRLRLQARNHKKCSQQTAIKFIHKHLVICTKKACKGRQNSLYNVYLLSRIFGL